MAITHLKPEPTEAAAAIGHNRPPVDILAKSEFDEQIDQHEGLRKRITDLVGAADRATATSEETMGRCGQTVIQIRACMKKIEDAHTTAKAPYLEGGRVIDKAKKELMAPLEAAKSKIEGKQQVYLRAQARADQERREKQEAEERRIQAENERRQREHEEAVRRAQEEAEAAGKPVEEVAPPEPVYIAPPAPKPIERGIIRGAEGAAISGRKVWKSEVQDYAAAFSMVASNPKVREAIDQAIAAIVRAGVREIAGVRIWEDVGVSNR